MAPRQRQDDSLQAKKSLVSAIADCDVRATQFLCDDLMDFLSKNWQNRNPAISDTMHSSCVRELLPDSQYSSCL